MRLADLPLQPLRVPACWEVVINQFYQVRPGEPYDIEGVRDGSAWELFVEDMLFLKHTVYDIGVDLGWYPDASPDGSFAIQVIFGEDWARPAAEFKTRELDDVVAHLETVLQRAPNAVFGQPPRRPKERGRRAPKPGAG